MATCTYATNDASTGNVWVQWNTCTSAATDTTTNGGVWSQWVTTGTASTSSYVQVDCWNQWNNTSVQNVQRVQYRPTQVTTYRVPELTAEQKAKRAADQAAQAEAYRKIQEEQAKANEKAEKLFREHLDDAQRKELAEKRHFHVISEKGKRFRISVDSGSGNISEIGEDGKVKRRLCAHPRDVPKFDQILAQKLSLELCEDRLLKVANVLSA